MLFIGLFVAEWIRPGQGVDAAAFVSDTTVQANEYLKPQEAINWMDLILHIVPHNIFEAFTKGDMLQILFFANLFGFALTKVPESVSLQSSLENLLNVLFKLLQMVMRLAPLGAFAGMAYTIGSAGVSMLLPLFKLVLLAYLTMITFITFILGAIAWYYKFNIFKMIYYIREELLIVLGTASSESVFPKIIEKLQKLGCSKSVVVLVLPAGYSFNLDGTYIYMSMAIVFLAQVYGVDLSWAQKFTIVGVLMITSKGAAAVTGSAFIILTSTLQILDVVPVAGMAILLGVDRFMSEARSITNLIGNAAATIFMAKHEGEFVENPEMKL